jgi:hypothetical protein
MANTAKYQKKKTEAQVKKELPKKGRGGDTLLAHLTKGEMIVPVELLDADKGMLRQILNQVFEDQGINPEEFIAGNKKNKINPETGYPEFFFKSVFKAAKSVVKSVVGVAKSVVKGVVGAVGGVMGGQPEAQQVNAPSTAAPVGYNDVEPPSDKVSSKMKRKRKGKKSLRIDGNTGLNAAGTGTGVGTGGATGASVNVPN